MGHPPGDHLRPVQLLGGRDQRPAFFHGAGSCRFPLDRSEQMRLPTPEQRMPKFPCARVGRCRKQVVDLLGISDESVRLSIAIRSTDFAEPAGVSG